MKRSLIPVAAVLACIGASSAMAAGETVSAHGSAQVPITPSDPTKNASILAAIADAQTRVYPAAIADATVNARAVAAAGNLTLGTIQNVSQRPAFGYGFPYGFRGSPIFVGSGPISGPINGTFCGYVTRRITKRVTVRGATKIRVVRRVREWKCFVPTAVLASVEVTFNATPKV